MSEITRRQLITSAMPAAALVFHAGDARSEAKDAQCAPGCYPVIPEETAAHADAQKLNFPPGDPQRYGAVANGTGNNTPAIQSAIAVMSAVGGGIVPLPAGTLRCESDVAIDGHVVLKGHQFGSHLKFVNASLLVDGSKQSGNRALEYCGIHDVRVSRTGSAGYAVRMIGDGGAKDRPTRDVVRFDVRRLQILGSSGGGLEIRGAYIGAFHNLIIQQCPGIGVFMGPQDGDKHTGVNGVSFFGGEIQNCKQAADLTRLRGVAFYGVVIEGNDEGVNLRRGIAVTFDTCYFEANKAYDLRVGEEDGDVYGIGIRTCVFFGRHDYAVELVRGQGISVDTCHFSKYTKAGIRHQPSSAGAVQGQHRNCTVSENTPRVADGENASFQDERSGRRQ